MTADQSKVQVSVDWLYWLIDHLCEKGKALLARHRLVNAALAEELKTIHAFSQKTFTPEQWQQKQSAQ